MSSEKNQKFGMLLAYIKKFGAVFACGTVFAYIAQTMPRQSKKWQRFQNSELFQNTANRFEFCFLKQFENLDSS